MAHLKSTGSGPLAISVALSLAGLIASETTALAGHGDGWAWKQRLLVVFAADAGSARLAEQRARLSGAEDAMRERHMSVVEIVGGRGKTVFGKAVDVSAAEINAFLDRRDGGFEAVLFGKDTGVKLRSREPVSAADLFSLIDSMPMRRREMRGKGS